MLDSEMFNAGFNSVMAETRSLRSLANAFKRTGNSEVSDEISAMIEWIELGCNDMSKAFNANLKSNTQFTREITSRLLVATLEGKIKCSESSI